MKDHSHAKKYTRLEVVVEKRIQGVANKSVLKSFIKTIFKLVQKIGRLVKKTFLFLDVLFFFISINLPSMQTPRQTFSFIHTMSLKTENAKNCPNRETKFLSKQIKAQRVNK